MSTAMQLPMADYVADRVGAPVPTLSASVAHRLLTRSPLHAWAKHPLLNPKMVEEASEAFDLGTAVHAVLLEGRDDLLAVIDAEDWRTKAAKAARDEARADGRIPVLAAQAINVQRMAQVARMAIAACPDLDGCAPYDAEQTIVYRHNETWLRCRPDLMAHDGSVIISYKTTSTNASPRDFSRSAVSFGYHMQAAFEINGATAMFGRRPGYVWVTQEVTPPFAISFTGLSPLFMDFATQQFEAAVALWADCLARNNWPSYPERVSYIDPPSWVTYQWDMEQAE